MAQVNFGRTETARLITPKGYCFFKELPHSLSDANLDLVREGVWLVEKASAMAPGTPTLNLPTAALTSSNFTSIGIPRFVFIDGDRHDVDWSEGLTVIDGWGWRASTTCFDVNAGALAAGDFLTVYHGASAAAPVGYLEQATSNDIVVALCTGNDGTWLSFVAVQPFLMP